MRMYYKSLKSPAGMRMYYKSLKSPAGCMVLQRSLGVELLQHCVDEGWKLAQYSLIMQLMHLRFTNYATYADEIKLVYIRVELSTISLIM